jgi:hypothetical protein
VCPLEDAAALLRGEAGTTIAADAGAIEWAAPLSKELA